MPSGLVALSVLAGLAGLPAATAMADYQKVVEAKPLTTGDFLAQARRSLDRLADKPRRRPQVVFVTFPSLVIIVLESEKLYTVRQQHKVRSQVRVGR